MNSVPIPYYWQALDFAQLTAEYPPPPHFYETVYRMPRDALRTLQEQRFLAQMQRAWEIPFFQRHWSNAGMAHGDIKSLDDLVKIPPYTVHDIRASIERNPPFGDFMGVSPADGAHMPLVLQTSGGTTGLPRPMLYAPQDRETMAILGGRRLSMQGVRPGDRVLVTYSLGLTNGGFMGREAIWKYSGALPVMTGSGTSTPTRRQIEIAKAWGINVVLGFPAYLRHMAIVARDEMGIDPKSLKLKVLGSHLGVEDRKVIEDLWGAPCMDSYGINETGMVASECSHQDGMHIHEDAVIIEICDPETAQPVPTGERGNMFITSLYKYSAPQIRFNVNDVSALRTGQCACGSTLQRLDKIFGRADNMIKLRGVNVFPEAVGALVAEDARCTGEYFCVVERVGAAGTEEMTVMVELKDASTASDALRDDLDRRFKEGLGVKCKVVSVGRGGLDSYTGVSQNSKIKRVLDRRAVLT
jgi:phenylacetate-CoA ligase